MAPLCAARPLRRDVHIIKIQKFPFPFPKDTFTANLIVVPRVRVRSPAHPSNPVQESHPNTGYRVPCRRACMILNFGSSPKINTPYMPSSWAAKGPLSNAHMDLHTPGASRNGAHSSRFSPSRTACVQYLNVLIIDNCLLLYTCVLLVSNILGELPEFTHASQFFFSQQRCYFMSCKS